jgi:hypothetical protein
MKIGKSYANSNLAWLMLGALSFVPGIGMAFDENPALPQSSAPSPDASPITQVTIEGHYDNAVGIADAASEGVVRGELLQDIPLLRPGETLETVPGLVVTQHSGDGKANQYFLRGYNLDHGTDFATSVDGAPVNMPTNAHGQGYSDVNFLIPELVQRIDYRKGPYYAGNGDFSAAGSADIHYRNSLDQSIADLTDGTYHYERMLFAGSTILAAPDQNPDGASGRSGPTLLGALELQHTDGPWAVPENLEKVNGLLRVSDGNRSNGWSVDSIHYSAKWYATDQTPLELMQTGQLGLFSGLSPSDGGNTGRDIISGEWHATDDAGFAKASAYGEHYSLQLWSDFTFFQYRPATGDQFEQVEDRNIIGVQVVKGWNHSLFGSDSTTELGLQIRHDNNHVGLLDTEDRVPFAMVSNDGVSETMTSLYLQNTTHWNPWLRTLLGLRDDRIAMNMTSYSLAANSGTASGNQVSPKLSAIFGPWDKTEFFIDAGKGFHSNDARGVIDKIDPTTGGPAAFVPALVSAEGKEIGLRTESISGLQSSLALWSLNSGSELVYNADSDIGSSTPNGASKRYGLEWNNHWIPNRWLLIDADLAWTHARFAVMNDNGATGDLIPNAVGKVGMLRASLHNVGLWSGEIETRYIGPYPLLQDGSLMAPSAIVTNLRVQRDVSPNMAISLDALNVFNREYFDIAYGQSYQVSPTSPVVPNGITVHPGEQREFRLTLRIKY